MKSVTQSTTKKNIVRVWHMVDVKDKVLGRVSSDIASKLMGKSKPYFVRNLDCGDYVVVVNAKLVAVTGKKEKQKLYGHYSGYPAGLKEKQLWQVRQERPEEIIRHAVMGMLPKNKIRDRLITRLYVFPDEKHTYQDKFVK
ncbi:MAG: 50S ribosomal protein L13 [bacterium]|nr:50S ribosomal protein L13 [bacterium]